jgi:hypothetical protein
MDSPAQEPFRFYDNREKALLFATTCSEKQETAKRVGREFRHLTPRPPALRVYQAAAGEGTLVNMVLRHLHHQWPSIPFLVVVKENDPDFVRMAVRSLADRFREHPELVLVFTNLRHDQELAAAGSDGRWRDVPLEGTSSHGFETQINEVLDFIHDGWRPRGAARPAASPSVLVLYRADQQFALDGVIPRPEGPDARYDLIVASQPYRCRLDAAAKVRTVLAPLAQSLAPGGRMLAVQSTGRDPGLEIVQAIWPGEAPFPTPRGVLVDALRPALADRPDLTLIEPPLWEAEFRFELQLNPEDVESNIGTSTLLAAWNAAAYVAQIDEPRLTEAMSHGSYLEATAQVVQSNRGLWFSDECFLVARAHR